MDDKLERHRSDDIATASADADPTASLEHIAAAVDRARGDRSAGGSAQFLTALTLLRELRAHIAAWEPDLIDAARERGASWAQLAPALGVASRQAAERRYLRLRPSPQDRASTADQRVEAERDRRAGQRAVAHWARDNAAALRQLAGQISALSDLPEEADGRLADLRKALGGDDAADLLTPLADTHEHLRSDHPSLAARLRELSARTDTVRSGARQRRRAGRSETGT